MKTERTWGWPIALDLFLGGLGGGIVIVSTVADLFFDGGHIFAPGNLAATVLLALGSSLLIFELGRPLQFWRVFSREKAIMTVGAWMLSLLIVLSFVYGTFQFSIFPWYGLGGLRLALAWLCLLLGTGVVIYTGILPGTMKARPFWNGPALPVLFLISGLSTGVAAQFLLVHTLLSRNEATIAEGFLSTVNIILLILELVVLLIYVFIMRTSTTQPAARAAASWLNGSKKLAFWGGLVGIGLIVPLILYALGINIAWLLASIGVLIGGIILRFLIVYSGERTLLPGEAEFLAKLPSGDEEFLHAWEETDHEAG